MNRKEAVMKWFRRSYVTIYMRKRSNKLIKAY